MSVIKHLIRKILGIAPVTTAVIAAGGSSERMEGGDKLFMPLCGKPVLAHTLLAFQKCDLIDEIIVVTRAENVGRVTALCKEHRIAKAAKVLAGGGNRLESVMAGVFAVSWKTEVVAIHDGARPCIDTKTIERTITKAANRHAAAPGVPVSSTLKKIGRNVVIETIDRENVVEIQTPQTFNVDLIKGALTNAKNKGIEVTDDCMAVEKIGMSVFVTKGSRKNIKITTKDDIIIAEAILGNVRDEG